MLIGMAEGRSIQKRYMVSEDGFIVSDNTFGSVQQIVLDPVFRGARLRNAFGGTVLDLRRSQAGSSPERL